MMSSSASEMAELKSLIIGVDQKINKFSDKLDDLDNKFCKMANEMKVEITQNTVEIKNTQSDLIKLKNDHSELEQGVSFIETQLHTLETGKLELIRMNIETRILELKEQMLLLEKHDRKYNVLLYGVKEEPEEDINQVFYNFVTKDLEIDNKKADEIPIANMHRIPSRASASRPQAPNPIIVRLMHFSDKQLLLRNGYKLANRKMRIVEDLPPIMKDARNGLANEAFKIRKSEKLQTRIRVRDTHILLETRLNSKDKWQLRKQANCI